MGQVRHKILDDIGVRKWVESRLSRRVGGNTTCKIKMLAKSDKKMKTALIGDWARYRRFRLQRGADNSV